MIPVIWYNAALGNWDSGLLLSIFNKYPETFVQYNVNPSPVFDRAIIIVVGRPEVAPLHEYLSKFKSGIVILTSEEDSFFDWKAAIPGHLEIWTQYYSANKSEIKERLLLGAPNRLANYKINSHLPKKYLWSFVGQLQNPFRQACVDVLKNIPDGFMHIADSFGGVENGIEYQEYLDIICQSIFVICPAGSMCVDSFRLYEAMECGAIPITNSRAPRDSKDFNYWNSTFPGSSVLQILDDASDLKERITIFSFDSYHGLNVAESNKWYVHYKEQLTQKLLQNAYTSN